MVLLFYLLAQRKKVTIVMSIGIWMLFNVFTGYNSVYNVSSVYKEAASVNNMPFYNANFNDICNYLEMNGIDKFAVCAEDGYRAVAFQLAYPDKKISGIISDENWDENMDIYVIDKINWSGKKLDKLLYQNESYCIFEK